MWISGMLSLLQKFTTALSFCEVCNQPVEQGSNRNVWINVSEFSEGFWKKNMELFCQERNTALVADSFSWHFTALFLFSSPSHCKDNMSSNKCNSNMFFR